MNQRWEGLYYRSPIWVQNLAVSALGCSLRHQRYGFESRHLEAALRESERWPGEALQKLVDSEVRRLVAHAFAHVPYYTRLARDTGLCAADFQSSRDLRKLPILEKTEVGRNPEAFRADSRVLESKVFTLNTSGTSGTPLTIFCDRASRHRHYAFWSRLRGWFGIVPGMSRATFFGRVVCPPSQARPPFWRHDWFQRNHLFSSYHLSAQNLPFYHDALRRLQPIEIIGYPSSLSVLACHLLANGLADVRPRVVFTTAETLLAHQRQMIERAFGCDVVDQYGCTEMALFVSQCREGTYHLHPEHGVLEVVGPDGEPVPDGVPGEAVCTGFVNMAMPLLRYRLGDRIVMGAQGCTCGRSFPVIAEIVGRQDDVLLTPSGRPLGRLDPVFKPLTGIRETQILQTSPDRLLVNLVVGGGFSVRDRENLLYELRKRTGAEMKIDIALVPEIPRGPNGKFRSVISLLRQGDAG